MSRKDQFADSTVYAWSKWIDNTIKYHQIIRQYVYNQHSMIPKQKLKTAKTKNPPLRATTPENYYKVVT